MANNIAFQPMGNTVALSVTTTSSNSAVSGANAVNQLMFANTGANAAFVSISTVNTVTAVAPVAGTPSSSFCIPAGPIKVISALQTSPTQTIYVAAITGTSTTTLYVTPGEGL